MRNPESADDGLVTGRSLRGYLVHPPRNDDGREEEEEVRRRIRLGRPLFDLVSELAAERDVGSLVLLYSGSTPLHAILADDVDSRGDAGFARRAGGPFRDTEPAAVHAARALAGLGLSLATGWPSEGPLRSALAWYADAGGSLAAHPWDPRDVDWDQPETERLAPLLVAAAGEDRWAGAALSAAVTLHALGSPRARSGRRSSVTVLLERSSEGVKARLLLSVSRGLPAGLVPDPQRMALFTGDPAFQQALECAWSQVRTRDVSGTVLWSIEEAQGPSPRIDGGSAGAAFAVAIDEIRRLSHVLPGVRVARRLQGSTAVIGRVDDLGYLQGVEGYEGKLGALGKGARVIVPAADTAKATRAAAQEQELEIVPATRWTEAARKARRFSGRVLLKQGLALFVGLAVAGTFLAVRFGSGEAQQHQQTVSAQLGRTADDLWSTDPSLAAQLAVAANNADRTSDTETRLLSAAAKPLSSRLTGPGGAVQSVAFSPGGKILAAGARDDKVWLWNIADPAHPVPLGPPLTGPKADIDSVAFSPDGATLAASSGNAVWRWHFADPAHPATPTRLTPLLAGPVRPLGAVVFSPDGSTLISADVDGTIWRWDVADPAHPVPLGAPLTGPKGIIFALAVSPVGGLLVAASGDGRIWVWRMTDPAAPALLSSSLADPAAGGLYSVAFSPNGKILAAGSYNSKVWLWDISDPGHPAPLGGPLTGPGNLVDSVAFSPDGTKLAATSSDDKVWLWNMADPGKPPPFGSPLTFPEPVVSQAVFSPQSSTTLATADADGSIRLWSLPGSVLIGPGGQVNSIAFGPHGKVVAASDTEGTVWLWDLADPRRPGVALAVLGGSVDAVAVSPDGQLLAATGNYGVVWLWDIADPAKPVPLPRMTLPRTTVHSLAFSHDGKILAVGGQSGVTGKVWLWDVSQPAHPARIGPPLPGPNIAVLSVTFSRTGNMLAFAGGARTIFLWNVTSPARPVRLSTVNSPASAFTVSSVAISPDGQFLAAATRTTVSLWRLADPAHPAALAPLAGPTSAVTSVAFAASGTMLAAGSEDAKVWLWSIAGSATPARLGQPLTGQAAAINAVAFAPDSDVLAAGGTGGITQLWNLDVDAAVTRICATTGNALTQAQWQQDVPGVPYAPPCAHPDHSGVLQPR